ncbi:Na+/H+ antiporter NhaA [Thermoleophilia bacterium SCSIO 60948]|nr:Na+/H+ antiporter NhaA [Thermoleophilia bacterium SCSIO 60948]
MSTESGGAGLLLAATLIALIWANSPWAASYDELWHTELAITLGDASLAMDLGHWVDDGLMILFFFVIGLELRREVSLGELSDRSRVAVPAIAGAAGILVPAAIFLALNPTGELSGGWGVVIATDTAFVLGLLALIGPACPTQLRVFLLTLSIVDDLIAVSAIGIFYSESVDPFAIAVAAGCLVGFVALSRSNTWRISAYVLLGTVLWVAGVESGLHPSIFGMLAGIAINATPPEREQVERAGRSFRAFRQSPLPEVGRAARLELARAVSVNDRFQVLLHPATSYAIVPLFALANAGVDLGGGVLGEALRSPLTWGVVAGLVVGKLVGISVAALGSVRLGVGELPTGVSGLQVVGGAALSGIGFTVSLLIADLAFDDEALVDQATIGILIAALLSALLGRLIFGFAARYRGQRTASLPRALSEPVDPRVDHVRGPVDAPLTLVEYADFECPFCGKATGMVRELAQRNDGRLRYVFRHLPNPEIHPHAELAAEAAEAAADQGKFWEMHDLLFANSSELEYEDLLGYAADLDLDVERFARDLSSGRHADRVGRDLTSAEQSGARGTPTFFVGERRHVGPYDAATLDAELHDAG